MTSNHTQNWVIPVVWKLRMQEKMMNCWKKAYWIVGAAAFFVSPMVLKTFGNPKNAAEPRDGPRKTQKSQVKSGCYTLESNIVRGKTTKNLFCLIKEPRIRSCCFGGVRGRKIGQCKDTIGYWSEPNDFGNFVSQRCVNYSRIARSQNLKTTRNTNELKKLLIWYWDRHARCPNKRSFQR